MSEKPLLLSSTKSTVVTTNPNEGRAWRIAATLVGVFVLVFGAADVMTRLAHATFGANASLYAFAPVVALEGNYGSTTTSRTPAAAPAALPATTTPMIPARLLIPAIGVNAAVEQVGKKDDGSMGTPEKFGDVAWYSLGQRPGQGGNAVIDGHVNNALTTAGVFQHLSQVALGDTITVLNASGTPMHFTVTSIQEYPADAAPAASIFAVSGAPQLVLITCDGQWVPSAKSFDKRLVVFASLK